MKIKHIVGQDSERIKEKIENIVRIIIVMIYKSSVGGAQKVSWDLDLFYFFLLVSIR